MSWGAIITLESQLVAEFSSRRWKLAYFRDCFQHFYITLDVQILLEKNRDGWKGFRGNSCEHEELVFTVKKICDRQFKSELEVFLAGIDIADGHPSFRLKGNPFWRSCTIYSKDAIVAQTNPLYRLGKLIYSRHKFRLTVYPGIDHSLVIAMLVAFFG